MQDLVELLNSNPYPGRGIVVGKDRVYYWIMGRSANSRNRIFVETEDGIRTEAHKPELVEDPSLIIYHPVRTMGKDLVVTNGDQTDTIVEAGDFRDGCMTREFEPDAPNFTPRISSILHADGSFELSILKHQENGRCLREFFCYEGADEGVSLAGGLAVYRPGEDYAVSAVFVRAETAMYENKNAFGKSRETA